MLRFGLLIGLTFFGMAHGYAFKEYPNETIYRNDFPKAKPDGQDGHWLKADRLHHTRVWQIANEVNLKKNKGFEEYQRIEERSAFYQWFQHTTDSLGFETKWPKIAAITTHKLTKLLSTIPRLTGNSNKEIKAFIIIGNQLIFDDIWKELQQLRKDTPLKGMAAKNWDAQLLWKEQNLINPSYIKLSHRSVNILLRSLRKESPMAKFFTGFEFEGNLLSIHDRWAYGMKMMGY